MIKLGIRLRLLLVVLAAVAIAIAGLVVGFNVILASTLDHNARDLVRSRAAAQLGSLRAKGGRISFGEAPDDQAADAYLWVFANGRALERPNATPAVQRAAQNLAGGPTGFSDLSSSDTRLYATPVVVGSKRVGTVVAGVSLAPYEQTRRIALVASLVFGALVLLLVGLAARWLVAESLRPVVRMTRQAAAWSEHDIDQRFALGEPHDELTELAETLDGLLDRVAASLRREQRFSAEVSHELRTPLARVLAEAELALLRPRAPAEYRETLELIHKNAGQLARIVDALVAAARHEASGHRGTADAQAVAESTAAACSAVALEHDIEIVVDKITRPIRVGLDPELTERILQPVIENACRYGKNRVRVSVARDHAQIVFAVDDDGPGVTDAEQQGIFDPGVRGTASRTTGETGAGLGLALARRLARSANGDIAADPTGSGGRFVIHLPMA